MDFVVLYTSGSELNINKHLLESYLSNKNSATAAMKYLTKISEYKAGLLTLTTELRLAVAMLDDDQPVIISKQTTRFNFPDRMLLTRGASKRAQGILKDCIDLSQAHAYGGFLYKAANIGLPLVPSAVAPFEQYESVIKDFLKKHAKL
ncbi:hypothetical protein GCM10007423_63920 [Dyadobacter endophyticus]|uniref:Uncharacterized protein n=1 Tax=Dyadobacter endophyticus TaxID=1749036 RepID=A0ABQ1ZD78_9BACT|nr:hypothetical protein [Dyadobacter endophyticus]GGH55895.1 hypothetical protein GCM10007423_63920 [Dyadobacter endophyticus]